MSSASSGIPCRYYKDYLHSIYVVRNGTQIVISYGNAGYSEIWLPKYPMSLKAVTKIR
jgi:hypothetical protein